VAKAGAGDAGLFVPFAFPNTGDDRPLFALNPSGTRLAVSWEGADSVHVFNARTGQAVTRFTSLKHVYCVAFASANALLVATEKGCVRFDLTRRRRETLLSDPGLRSIDLSPDSRIVAFGIEHGVVLYDTRNKQVLHRLTSDLMGWGFEGVWGRLAAFSAGARYMACAILDWYYHAYFVVIWEVQTARALRYRARDRAWELLLDNGSIVRIAAATGRVTVHTAAPLRERLQRAVVSADWSAVAAAAPDGIAIYSTSRRLRTPISSRLSSGSP
jgi:WD40 repeat protein